MKLGLVKALVPNLNPPQKLKELHSLHLSAQLVEYPRLWMPCAWFAVSRRQHQACFRKALCTQSLLNWEVKAVAFSENDWLFWWSKESPSRDEQGTPLLSVSDEALEGFGGWKAALFNYIFKVNIFHLQAEKVDNFLFSAHFLFPHSKQLLEIYLSCSYYNILDFFFFLIRVFILWCARKS